MRPLHRGSHPARRQLRATKEELTEAIWVATVMRAAASMQRSRAAFSILEGLGR
jgi:hypothetical protein